MITAINSPVLAQCHLWASGDTIAAHLAGDSSTYPLANVKDPVLHLPGQTANNTDPGGFDFTLASQVSICAVGLVNTGALASEDVRIKIASGTGITPITLDTGTAPWPMFADDIWTGHSFIPDKPQRFCTLLGFDDYTGAGAAGPAVGNAPDTVLCRSGRIEFSTADAGRTEWSTGFLALGRNAVQLPGIDAIGGRDAFRHDPINLNHGLGDQFSIAWPHVTSDVTEKVWAIWQRSGFGTWPVFFFLNAPNKSTAGVISGTDYSPSLTGGVMRLLSVKREGRHQVGTDWNEKITITAQSWQGVRI